MKCSVFVSGGPCGYHAVAELDGTYLCKAHKAAAVFEILKQRAKCNRSLKQLRQPVKEKK